MIKTKKASIIFLILSLIVFPYYIIFLQSDFLSSMVPGWHTTIVPWKIIPNSIKFIALLITTILYWNLSRINTEIALKTVLLHLSLTIPAVFIGRINLYELFISKLINPEKFINSIQLIIFTNICLNTLFFTGQIIFWRYYFKSKKSSKILNRLEFQTENKSK
jgi:hypothetical protein